MKSLALELSVDVGETGLLREREALSCFEMAAP